MDNKRIVSMSWDRSGHCQGLCLKKTSSGLSLLHAWQEEVTDSLSETLERGAEILGLDKATLVIAGPLESFCHEDITFPVMKKNLLGQALNHQLPKYFPHETRELTSAHHILSQDKENFQLRIWTLKKSEWQIIIDTLSASHHKFDTVMSPETAAMRLFPDKKIHNQAPDENGFFSLQVTEEIPGFNDVSNTGSDWQVNNYGSSYCLAAYAASEFYEYDKPDWFKTPISIRPRRSVFLQKYTYFMSMLCIIMFLAFITTKGKYYHRSWKLNNQFIESKKNALTDIRRESKQSPEIEKIFEETVTNPVFQNEIDIVGLLHELTIALPQNYWAEYLSLSRGKVSCTIKVDGEETPGALYNSLNQVKNFQKIKIASNSNGYRLEFLYQKPDSEETK